MSLRRRTLAVVIFVLIVTSALVYFVVSGLFLQSFASLEEEFILQNVQRATNVLDDSIKNLDVTTEDYAGWDDTYEYAQDGNEQYIEDNYYDETFDDLALNFLIITNETGEPLFYKAYDLENSVEIPFDPDLLASLTDDSLFQQFSDESSYVRGIFLPSLEKDPIIVASRPILTSMSTGPIQGAFIMARALDDYEMARLNELTNLDFTLYQLDGGDALPPEAQEALVMLEDDPDNTVFTLEVDRQTAVGYSSVDDVFGNPAVLVQIRQPRDIYQQGQASIRLTMLALSVVGVVLSAVVLILLDRLVLRRLSYLSTAVAQISTEGDLSQHINVPGSDEIAQLADDFNQMLDSLAHTQADLAQAKEKAEQANLAKSSFISMVTHEMRVPLTSVRGYADLLLDPRTDPLTPRQQSFVEPIRKNSLRMESLIKDLSDLERIETGQLHLLVEAISLHPAIEETAGLLQAELERKKQTLHIDLPSDLPFIHADNDRLIQVLLNLVSNAYKYTPEGGDITIRAQRIPDEPTLQITISDTGYGIPPNEQQHIFSQFFRASGEEVRQEVGTGLGLYITKLLVEMQNGRIWFESIHKKGTIFHFTLPIAES